jgi:hypothetical protein
MTLATRCGSNIDALQAHEASNLVSHLLDSGFILLLTSLLTRFVI